MRVIAGTLGSRRLVSLKGDSVRPTADRVKAAMFSILGGKVKGARVLDLFCGSGALGIEAVSRGAASAVFVDTAKQSAAVCKKNLTALGIEAEVHLSDYQSFLCRQKQPFDIIFLDPPYDTDLGQKALFSISSKNLICDFGIIVLEDRVCGAKVQGLEIVNCRKYGNSFLTFYTKSAAAD